MNAPFKFDLAEEFPHLSKAPIVEAAFDIRARASIAWEQESVEERIRGLLPDYPQRQSQRRFQGQLTADTNQPFTATVQDLGWHALVCRTADGLQVAQFQADGFIFSRLAPYLNWDSLQAEALRLWDIYRQIAAPSVITRIGVRFINRLSVEGGKPFEDYLVDPPKSPGDLQANIMGYLSQSTFQVPEHPYFINLAQTLDVRTDGSGLGIILDIDVYTTQEPAADADLTVRLQEMRWLKNKIFFSSLTKKIFKDLK
ncbi:MAG: TIGR04255 family protein [Pyrinomonadaceae bacterium]